MIGNAVAAIATPIARALKLPCIDPITKQPKPESGCAKRKAWLNSLTQNTTMKLNISITETDDNNLIFESRGRPPVIRTIPRDKDAGKNLFAAVEAAFKANTPPARPQPATTTTPDATTPAKSGK